MPDASLHLQSPQFAQLLRASVYRPLVVLLLLAVLFVGQVTYLISLTNWVEHTDLVIAQSNEVLKHFGYASTGFRSFAAQGDPIDLEEYRSGMRLVTSSLNELRNLISDTPEQLQAANLIQNQIHQWSVTIEELTLKWQATPSYRPSANGPELERLRELRGAIRASIEGFITVEENHRVHRLEVESAATALILILTLLLCLGLGIFLASSARRQLRTLSADYESALRLRDDFLAIASHELKTPVTSLQLQLRVAKARFEHLPANSAEILRFQRSINLFARQTQRLTVLIESIINVSQIQSRNFRIEPEEFELATFLRSVSQLQSAEFEQIGSKLSLRTPEGVLVVWDRKRIEQAIVNILSNAIKYAPGAPVEINARADAGAVRIEIIDHGPGLSEKIRSRLFERFARGHEYEKISGMGLGLYIAREIALAHSGRISVEPVIPGPGTCFSLELPRIVAPEAKPKFGKSLDPYLNSSRRGRSLSA